MFAGVGALWVLVLVLLLVPAVCAFAETNSDQPPTIYAGLDSYTHWDRWPYLRIGQRTYMTSTYDRRGANESADASHFLYQLADDRNVTLDVTGPGILVFARYNHWHGSPWHYTIDGSDNVVQETSSADPTSPKPDSVFIPEEQFPNPLTWTWSQTKGADLMWVPLPFEKSFRMAYERTHYGTGYYIYQKFAQGTELLNKPIRSWSPDDVPPAEVLDIINRSGEDIAPTGADTKALCGTISLQPGQTAEMAAVTNAPSTIRALKFVVPKDQADAFSKAQLRIYWDGAEMPSVDAPVNLFFGAGSLHNREDKQYLVKAFPVNIRFDPADVRFACYLPMPFMRSAKIELVETQGESISGVDWSIRYEGYTDPANWVGNLHATYVDHGTPVPGKDLVFLDTTKVEGGGEWCGHFVGTSFIFSDRAVLNTLEGDPRFFFDDSNTPQAQGTGTEEWCGGGDYWGGRNMTLPFAGHPVGCRSADQAENEEDKIQSAYRFLLADVMPFGRNARIQLEHGGTNNSEEHYRSVTFWYGIHQPCLILTDTLDVGDAADEAKHHYVSPDASEPETVTSRYEWGVDHVGDQEIYPATTDTGRHTAGASTFRLKLEPGNLGVLLRRKMDYSYPNQCARVMVRDADGRGDWNDVGVWLTAGSNTVVYSNPRGELGATEHHVQTSNRRWRDDEFLIPRHCTRSVSELEVRVEFQPRGIPLYPGQPVANEAWSEFQYKAYCYVMPRL